MKKIKVLSVAVLPLVLLLAPLLLDASNLPSPSTPQAKWITDLAAQTTAVLTVINTAFIDVFRIAWITVICVGALLYLTHLHRKFGKELVVGGIGMMVLVQFLLPWLATFFPSLP